MKSISMISSDVLGIVRVMENLRRVISSETEASELPIFSESLLATAFYQYKEILLDLGYRLVHNPGTLTAFNRKKGYTEVARPDFEVLRPPCLDRNNVLLEVTETLAHSAVDKSAKQKQLRVMNDYQEHHQGYAGFLLPWEAITHPIWSLRMVRALAEKRISSYDAVNMLFNCVDSNHFPDNPFKHL